MAKRHTKNKKDFEAWLLKFEKQAGRPVVVSLLIEEGSIDFVSVIRKKVYLQLNDDVEGGDDGPPEVDFAEVKADIPQSYLNECNYIG